MKMSRLSKFEAAHCRDALSAIRVLQTMPDEDAMQLDADACAMDFALSMFDANESISKREVDKAVNAAMKYI
jgi:hypothetical protein